MELVAVRSQIRPPLFLDARASVLVIERERRTRDRLRDMFFALRVRMYEAIDDGAARGSLRCGDVDLVLLNPSLPNLNGPSFLRWCRGLGLANRPPIVLLGGEDAELQAQLYRPMGVHDFIERPISFGQLATTCRRFGLLPRLEN